MTTPRINTIKRGGSRLYVHPASEDKVPGVTSVLNMLPKPFLRFWAGKVCAEYAVDNLGTIVNLVTSDPKTGKGAAVDLIKRAPDRFTNSAAGNGSDVHDVFEQLARGNTPYVSPEIQPYVDVYQGFVATYKPNFLFLEETVWSEQHGYAGSFDFIAEITDPDTDERLTVIGDWKTTRSGVHAEVAIQETAYKYADYIVRPDGTTVPIPHLDAGIVVHVAHENKEDDTSPIVGQVVACRLDDDLFKIFLALRQVWEYEGGISKTVLGDATPITPVVSEPATVRRRRGRAA